MDSRSAYQTWYQQQFGCQPPKLDYDLAWKVWQAAYQKGEESQKPKPPETHQAKIQRGQYTSQIMFLWWEIKRYGEWRFSHMIDAIASTDMIVKNINPIIRPFCRVWFIWKPEDI